MITIGQLYWFFPKDHLIPYAEHIDDYDLWKGPWLYLRSEQSWEESWVDPKPGSVECELYISRDEIEVKRIGMK